MSSFQHGMGNHWKMGQAGNLISLDGHRPRMGRDARNIRNEMHRDPVIRAGDELGGICRGEVILRNLGK